MLNNFSTNMNISFEYSTQEEHDIMALALEDRFHAAKNRKGYSKIPFFCTAG